MNGFIFIKSSTIKQNNSFAKIGQNQIANTNGSQKPASNDLVLPYNEYNEIKVIIK